ncbi:MAG: acyl carrier protein [Pseudolabrys sp.]|nr:acyl carrier protein [Pseudolabrys sp.]MBV9955105.1 acyl carrier protein [Pseudolabrys sp.]
MSVESDVIEIVKKKARVQKPDIGLDDKLEDLGFESLDAVEMIFDLEEKFDIQIPFNANDQKAELSRVGDIVRAIEPLVKKKT